MEMVVRPRLIVTKVFSIESKGIPSMDFDSANSKLIIGAPRQKTFLIEHFSMFLSELCPNYYFLGHF